MDSNLVDYMYMQTISLFSKRKLTSICLFCLPSQNTDTTWRCRRKICSNDNIDSLAVDRSIRTWHTQIEHLDALVHPLSLLSNASIGLTCLSRLPFQIRKELIHGLLLLPKTCNTSVTCLFCLPSQPCTKCIHGWLFSFAQNEMQEGRFLLFFCSKSSSKLSIPALPISQSV